MSSIFKKVSDGLTNAHVLIDVVLQREVSKKKNRDLDGKTFQMARPQGPYGPFIPILPITPAPKIANSTTILRKGTMKEDGMKALEADMILETDVKIPMRGGVHLYADIYRPADESVQYPAVLVWSPYGKHLNMDTMLSAMPGRIGLNKSECSGYEDFESPDPALYVPRGYAVVNIDIRGSWRSEGDFFFWGKQDQVDGYDTIEYLATLPWCSGKIGMAGNSWLAISQWYIAAGKPPHLAAVAPWEALTDAYRDNSRRGGIPATYMSSGIRLLVPGSGLAEDAGQMSKSNPVWNEYWEDKKVDLDKITVPAYILASYTSKVHVSGSFRAFRNISSQEKWLRVHPYQEWYDFVKEQDDLLRFFDYYLKGVENGWPSTPAVRCSLLRLNGPPIINKVLDSFPPSSGFSRKYFLDSSSSTAVETNPLTTSTSTYQADGKGEVHFDIKFDEFTALVGYPSVRLVMQCKEHDDMDVYVILRKLNKEGVVVEQVNFPKTKELGNVKLNPGWFQGPTGMLRASHRALQDSNQCAPGELFHPHSVEEKISPGTIVPLEFNTWPIGLVYEAGESLRLSVSGKDMSYPEAEHLPTDKTYNRGKHVIHTGGQHESWISIPIANLD